MFDNKEFVSYIGNTSNRDNLGQHCEVRAHVEG
jgi:hypothetical protein